MSTKKSEKAPRKVSDKEADGRIQARKVAEGRALPTPASAPKVSAVDRASEKRAIQAETTQQKNLREAHQAQVSAAKDRSSKKKAAAPAHDGAFSVENPTGDYLEFTFRGETLVLAPGTNEFADGFLPGVKGEEIAQQAVAIHGFPHGVTAKSKAPAKKALSTSDEVKLPETTAGAVAYPEKHYQEIKGVSNPSADERAQPFRFPASTEHDPQGEKTKATKEALVDLHEKGGDAKSAPRVKGAKR